jgi:hypothetical protein
MNTNRNSAWYRRAWWLPGVSTAIALCLVVATLHPTEQNILLSVAILCALPWSLALLLLHFGEGFADRAAIIVCIGLCTNTALLWWSFALLRSRFRDHHVDLSDAEA